MIHDKSENCDCYYTGYYQGKKDRNKEIIVLIDKYFHKLNKPNTHNMIYITSVALELNNLKKEIDEK